MPWKSAQSLLADLGENREGKEEWTETSCRTTRPVQGFLGRAWCLAESINAAILGPKRTPYC